jgi:2-C-methyl-D-erythritol 4-phosphate cytidylyltransferase
MSDARAARSPAECAAMARFAVIIPAAGAGKRFGGSVKKPFAQIDGRPIFIRTIELFINRADVCQTILTVAPEDYDVVREKYAANIMFMGFKLVRGGQERFESVSCALAEVADEADFVCVHDAVRPCVLEEWLNSVFAAAENHDAAILAAPLAATIKRVANDAIRETVPRAGLWEAQTPQVFRKELLRRAYAERPSGAMPTDDAELVERLGVSVRVVEADRRNLKITTPGDLTLAASILAEIARNARKSGPRGAFEEAQW